MNLYGIDSDSDTDTDPEEWKRVGFIYHYAAI